MRQVIAWLMLAGFILAVIATKRVVSRLVYGRAGSVASQSSPGFKAKVLRARRLGWRCAIGWTLCVVAAIATFWPPTTWLMLFFGTSAVFLVAVLVGLDAPRPTDLDDMLVEELTDD